MIRSSTPSPLTSPADETDAPLLSSSLTPRITNPSAPFSPESLARVAIPVGVVTAGRDSMLVPRFHSGHVLAHCRRCSLLAELPAAAHLDLLAPWPQDVARDVAARQSRGGELSADFDPRERTAAFEKIAAFFRRHLDP